MRILKTSIRCLGLLSLIIMISAGCTKKTELLPEVRGVWLHTGLFSMDESRASAQMDSLFGLYREIGINNLFCYNATPEENSFEWDYLAALIREGNKKNITIHPIFYPGYNINLEKELVDHPGWLIRDMEGKYQPHFNLSNPEVQKYWVDRISAVLKYDVGGIHLDYIRVPLEQVYSYDSLTCEAFKKIYQYSPLEVSHDCGSMIWCEWIKWNARQVTQLVKGIREAIEESGKPVLLGADVFPDAVTSDVLIAQEWGRWGKEGLVDFICPMLYTNNPELFHEYLKTAIDLSQGNCRVYPGIGVLTSHNNITKELIIKEVNITREEKTNGMVFFSGNSFNQELRDTLKVSVFKLLRTADF
jgi:uncharacterized lipoprotein YddW (UPF0748 family)